MYLTRRAKRRLLILVGVVMLLGVLGMGAWILRGVRQSRMAEEARAKGVALFERRDYAAALPELSFAVSRNPLDVGLITTFAETRSKVIQPNAAHLISAAGYYKAALKLDPTYEPALDGLLDMCGQLGWRAEEVDVAKRIRAIDPRHVGALTVLLRDSVVSDRWDDAIAFADELAISEPDNPQWLEVALVARSRQGATVDEVLALCDERMASWSRDGRFRLVKVGILRQLGRDENAVDELIAAATMGAADAETLQLLCDTLDGMSGLLGAISDESSGDRLAHAERLVSAAIKAAKGDPAAQVVLVRRLWLGNRIDDALAQVDEARENLGHNTPELLRWKASLLALKSDRVATLAALDDYAAELGTRPTGDPDVAWIAAMRANSNARTLEWRELSQRLETALALEAGSADPMLMLYLGDLYAGAGEDETAERYYERAFVATGNAWLLAGTSQVQALERLNRPGDAVRVALLLVERHPRSVPAYIALGQAWIALEAANGDMALYDPVRATRGLVAYLGSLYEAVGRSPTIAPMLVQGMIQEGRTTAARDVINQVLASEDPSEVALVALARLSLDAGLGDEEALLDEAERLGGITLDTASVRASMLHRAGRSHDGLTVIEDAIAGLARSGDGGGDTAQSELVAERTRLQYLAWAGLPEAADSMRSYLSRATVEPAAAAWALDQPITWQDKELARLAIERLRQATAVGEPDDEGAATSASLRVVIADANWTLRFAPDDESALQRSRSAINSVLQRTPDSLPLLSTMASLLQAGSNPQPASAARLLRDAVARYPGQAQLYPPLIALLQQQGDFTTASRYLDAYAQARGSGTDSKRIESAFRAAQGDYDAAIANLKSIAAESGDETDAMVLASVQVAAGKLTDAERTLRPLAVPAAAGARTNLLAVRGLADVLVAQGRMEEATALIESPHPGAEPVDAAIMATGFHLAHGHLSDVERWLADPAWAESDRPEHAIFQSQVLTRQGQVAEAIEVLNRALERWPDNEGLLTVSGTTMLMDTAQQSGALERFKALESKQPDLAALLQLVDQAATEADKPSEELLVRVRKFAAEHPTMIPAWRFAVLLHSSAGQQEESIRLARTAMARNPTSSEPAEWLTTAFTESGRTDDALDAARTWRRRAASDPIGADVAIARLQLITRRPGEALTTLQPHAKRLVAAQAANPNGFTTWIATLILNGRPDEAALALGDRLRTDAAIKAMWMTFAHAAAEREAVMALEAVEPMMSEDPTDRLGIAAEWAALTSRTGVSTYAMHAETLVNGAPGANQMAELHVRAAIAEALGRAEEAEAAYREILAIQPDDVGALNNLAMVLAARGGHDKESIDLIDRAILLAPDLPDLVDTRAQVLLSVERFDEAAAAAGKAVLLRPGDPTFLLTLGRVQAARGQVDAARRSVAEAETALRSAMIVDRRQLEMVNDLREQLEKQ